MPKPKHQQTTRRRIVLPSRKRLRASTSAPGARLSVQDRGRIGGKSGCGAAKARTPEQARAAAGARWARERAAVDAHIRAAISGGAAAATHTTATART